DRMLKRSPALVELIFGEQHSPGEAAEFHILPCSPVVRAISNPSCSAASAAARSPCHAKPSARNAKPYGRPSWVDFVTPSRRRAIASSPAPCPTNAAPCICQARRGARAVALQPAPRQLRLGSGEAPRRK